MRVTALGPLSRRRLSTCATDSVSPSWGGPMFRVTGVWRSSRLLPAARSHLGGLPHEEALNGSHAARYGRLTQQNRLAVVKAASNRLAGLRTGAFLAEGSDGIEPHPARIRNPACSLSYHPCLARTEARRVPLRHAPGSGLVIGAHRPQSQPFGRSVAPSGYKLKRAGGLPPRHASSPPELPAAYGSGRYQRPFG